MGIVVFEVFWELCIDNTPPLPVVLFPEALVVKHKVPDVFDPLAFFVVALLSCVSSVAVGAEFGNAAVVDSDTTTMHREKLWNRAGQLHLDQVGAVADSVSFRV